MIKIYNKFIPQKGFLAMITLIFLWIRKEYKGSDKLDEGFFNHEKIHMYQQLEIMIPSLLLALLSTIFLGSCWWILLSLILPLILYMICWIIELVLPPRGAYGNICFESEAIYNEWNLDYFRTRKLFDYSWIKYISNRKYPYLSHRARKDLWKNPK